MSKGFTFIEVLLCLLLCGMGLLGALASQIYARQQVLMATQRLVATAIVADVAAALQSVPAVAGSFQGSFDQAPPAVKLCQDDTSCSHDQLLQSQIDQRLAVLLSGSAAGLPFAQLCIVAAGNQPEIQLSWRGVIPSKFKPASSLCPLPADFAHVALRANGGL